MRALRLMRAGESSSTNPLIWKNASSPASRSMSPSLVPRYRCCASRSPGTSPGQGLDNARLALTRSLENVHLHSPVAVGGRTVAFPMAAPLLQAL